MRLLLYLGFAATLFAADPNRLTFEEQRAGWVLLFDGKTTAGWEEVTGKPFPDTWTIDKGCLKAVVKPGGAQDIRTESSFKSFDLQFEWKVLDMGNSGVKYLIQNEDEWTNKDGRQARARGLEYQLADEKHPDAASDLKRTSASLYSLIAPLPKVDLVIGAFNQSRIVVRGRKGEHWLNGVKAVSFDLDDPAVVDLLRKNLPKTATADTKLRTESAISLQNHGSDVWFRNIKILRLD